MTPTRRTLLLGLASAALAGCASTRPPRLLYLNGSVSQADSASWPQAKSLLSVRLLDISDAAAAPVLIAEQLREQQPLPAGFSLCYDAQAVQSGQRYVLDARLFVDGELKMQTRERVDAFLPASASPQLLLRLVAR